MTNFLKTEIPDEIQTIEQLSVWCTEILQYLYPDMQVPDGFNEDGTISKARVIESNKFFFTVTDAGVWRHAARHFLELNKNHLSGGRIWQHVRSLGDEPIPAGMKKA